MGHIDSCAKCIEIAGGCCTDQAITIQEDKAQPFLDVFAKKQPKGHTLEYDKRDHTYEYRSKGPCIFLGKDKSCQIYDQRPLICQMYPILWEGKPLKFYLDKNCMLVHKILPEEFRKWVGKKETYLEIELLGELDFDIADPKYVVLDHLYDKNWIIPVINTDN